MCYRAKKYFLTKCTKLRIFGKRILVIFGRAPSPPKWIHWATKELKYLENLSKSISWAQNRVFVWCDSNRAKFTRRCQTCFFLVFLDAWGRQKKVAVVERLKKESMYELSVVVESWSLVEEPIVMLLCNLDSNSTKKKIFKRCSDTSRLVEGYLLRRRFLGVFANLTKHERKTHQKTTCYAG